MDLLVGLFVTGLYQAVEKIWGKVFDAAWDPLDVELKERFRKRAGKGIESERHEAFARADGKARQRTIKQADDPQETEIILRVINRDVDPEFARALANEAAKVLLFAEEPDLQRMVELTTKQLKWEAFFKNETSPDKTVVGQVLTKYLENLRLTLMDEVPYRDLIQHEMLRTMQKVLQKSIDNVSYDGEAEYIAQLVERFQYLDFVGIPELKDRQSLRIEDLFVHLQAEIE